MTLHKHAERLSSARCLQRIPHTCQSAVPLQITLLGLAGVRKNPTPKQNAEPPAKDDNPTTTIAIEKSLVTKLFFTLSCTCREAEVYLWLLWLKSCVRVSSEGIRVFSDTRESGCS